MCGIVGVLQYESKVSKEVRHRALKILFSDAMLNTETRGEDATGIYQVHTDGDWAMAKKGVKASEWLFSNDTKDDPASYSDFMDSWLDHPQELTALVGHCRKATVGSKGLDNDDNHPFAVQLDEKNAILGIHNGTLHNHERIFSKLPKFLKRQGKVDSEAIFHLMFHLTERGSKPWDEEMMKKLGKRLDGAAACIVVNTRFPHKVATWRFGRPMEYFLIAPLNIVIICSEKKFVEAALEKYDLYRVLFDQELPALETYDTALTEKDFRIFDTSVPWPAGKPGFKDMNDISVRGDVKSFQGNQLEEGWYTPATTSQSTGTSAGTGTGTGTAGYRGTGASRTSGAASSSVAGGAKTAKMTKGSPKQLPATTGKKENDEVVTIEVEIGSEGEAKEATVRAKSMGICTHYDSEPEIAKTIGLTQVEMDALSKVGLANLIAKSHFNFGYSVARFDTKAEIEKTRKGGRDLTKRLERSEEKKGRSENRIWELKQLITLMMSLDQAHYPITEQNIGIALSAFRKIAEPRRKAIQAHAKDIFADSNVRKVIADLRKRYNDAKETKERRKERTASSKD